MASERVVVFADISHPNRVGQEGGNSRARDRTHFFSFHAERLARRRNARAIKNKIDPPPVDLTARAHAFDNFLPCVATLRVADVALFQPCFVGNLLFAEVVPKPRHALRKPLRAHRRIAHWTTAAVLYTFRKNLPKTRQFFPFDEEFASCHSAWRTPLEPAGNRRERCLHAAEL